MKGLQRLAFLVVFNLLRAVFLPLTVVCLLLIAVALCPLLLLWDLLNPNRPQCLRRRWF